MFQREVPYILTLLFGVLGYTINDLSKNLFNIPFIEYQIELKKDTVNYLECRITNISKDKAYDTLLFEINHQNTDTKFTRALIIPDFPFYLNAEELSIFNTRRMGTRYVNFATTSLIPFSTYLVRVDYQGTMPQEPRLVYDIQGMRRAGKTLDDVKIYLRKADYLSWVAKNQLEFYTLLIIIWLITIVIYFIFMPRNTQKTV